jgi:glycosyltransferase involved in cell wall biosynthesis
MLSLIILSYNDGRSLREILPSWITVLEKITNNDYELIVSDDAGTDDTELIVSEFYSSNKNVHYVRSISNHGVGANFRMGVQRSNGDYVAYTDGDGQYLAEDLPLLWQNKDKYDCISGNRIHRADPMIRSIASAIYNFLVKLIYRVNVKDINSGLKLFNRNYIQHCMPQLSNGPFYDAEYMIKGYYQKMKIKEFAIAHRPRLYGKAAGISKRSLRLLFSELCNINMKPFVRKNYFSVLLFNLLSIYSKRRASSSNTLMLPNDSSNVPFNT